MHMCRTSETAGIICAGDTEFEAFLPHIHILRSSRAAMLTFYEGTVGGIPVAALFSGVCKVNAAVACQLLIDRFGAGRIINAGTAGGIADEVNLFDTIIAERAAYHDVAPDILTEFHPWMQDVFFRSDAGLLEAARRYAAHSPHPLRFGTIVSGEQFIGNSGREDIRRRFAPLAADMETAACAHVCYVNSIPFLSVRTITDTETQQGVGVFEQNCEKASRISADITAGILAELTEI